MDLSAITTYQALVYRSRAYRSTKAVIQQILKDHDLTVMQWSVLGFVKDAGKQGIRISDLAEKVDSSLAFITNSVNALEKKGMVYRVGHETDNRAKLVCVVPKCRPQLDQIETELHEKLWGWFEERVDPKDLETYIKVLRSLAQPEN